MSRVLIRSGIEAGVFPQRSDRPLAGEKFEAALGRIANTFAKPFRRRRGTGERIVTTVADLESGMRARSAQSLADETIALRQSLRVDGLSDVHASRCFALVREMARRTIGMRHFDVQVLGGYLMLRGMVAEMDTGEGKTLTATLPAAAAALSGADVHMVTVNDYLASRDAEWMRPLYEALGISVGVISAQMDTEARRAAYACDITYCSNKQLVFDYLRDSLALGNNPSPLRLAAMRLSAVGNEPPLLRGLSFAIVDEADSVLIDEARTPLVISDVGNAGETEAIYVQAVELAGRLDEVSDFSIDRRQSRVTLTDAGKQRLAEFSAALEGVWASRRWREEFVRQALSALHVYVRDKDYLLRDDKVQVIDEFTGRVMPDRTWERGLHQMIEAKEGCPITGLNETKARITYQRFFRRYLHLAGMTGTAREVAPELWSVYRLKVERVPTNVPANRRVLPNRVFATADNKWQAVVSRTRELIASGRPVLIGTRSVLDSEHLSELLSNSGVAHDVLNARQDQDEAEVIAAAGGRGRVTVATNMAGRGTDIRLEEGVVALGGLHVIATELHEARRIDRQLFGRCGRQGDPGSFEAILSLDDELLRLNFGDSFGQVLRLTTKLAEPLPAGFIMPLVKFAQRATERRHARIRRNLLEADDQLLKMLAFRQSGRI